MSSAHRPFTKTTKPKMQIANGLLILCPEHQLFVRDVTPAEALILYRMHAQNANGTPLGDFFIQPGEAQTIEVPAKPAVEPAFDMATGLRSEAKPAVPAVTHKRTNAEEITRLKKKYTGMVTDPTTRTAVTAFAAAFGNASAVRLPERFEELDGIGHLFREQTAPTASQSAAEARFLELGKLTRAKLCEIALPLALKIHPSDTKEQIINAIIAAQAEKSKPEEAPKE